MVSKDYFVFLIENNPLRAWEIVARWYINDLFVNIEKNKFDIYLALDPDQAVRYFAKCLLAGQKRLNDIRRYKKTPEYTDFDNDSTREDRIVWDNIYWAHILEFMDNISYTIGNQLKRMYDDSFGDDFVSMTADVDYNVVRCIMYKKISTSKDDSDTESSEHDSEYEPADD